MKSDLLRLKLIGKGRELDFFIEDDTHLEQFYKVLEIATWCTKLDCLLYNTDRRVLAIFYWEKIKKKAQEQGIENLTMIHNNKLHSKPLAYV